MRKISKNIALLLALVMLAALIPTAMADEGSGDEGIMPASLQPLDEYGTEYRPIEIDLTDQDPDALDKVPMKTILERLNAALEEHGMTTEMVDVENSTVAWTKRYRNAYFGQKDDYKLPVEGNLDLAVGYTVYELEWPDYNYAVTADDIADLRSFYTNDPACVYLLLIVGERANDQLNLDSKRFVVKALLPQENMIMDFSATNADEGADNAQVEILNVYKHSDYYEKKNIDEYQLQIPFSFSGKSISLKMDFKASLKSKYSELEVYSGIFDSRETATAEKKLPDNTLIDNFRDSWWYRNFTAFYKDSSGKERINYFTVSISKSTINITSPYDCLKHVKTNTYVPIYSIYYDTGLCPDDFIYQLSKGMEPGDEYTLKLGASNPENPSANALDNIKSVYESESDDVDVKEQLFGTGYTSSQFGSADGVDFFITDINGVTYWMRFKVLPYEEPDPGAGPEPSNSTSFTIRGVGMTENGSYYPTFASEDDTYNKRTDNLKEIYQTVFILDSEANIMENADGYIYPTWSAGSGAKVYWPDSSGAAATEKTSGKSPLKFTPGEPVQITVEAESGKTENYYVTFIAQKEEAELYVLGENVQDSNYDENLQIPGRLVHLGDIERRETYYDIMFANIGKTNLSGITVSWERDPEIVKIDDYWTVQEGAELGAFDSVYDAGGLEYGVLGNIGKIRLVPTYDEDGKIVHGKIDGILKIAAGDKEVKIKITGIAGTPKIVTETLSDQDAVKFVPYGVVLQTNYVGDEGEQFAFEINPGYLYGTLPAGIELTKTGALYGTPISDAGEYSFKVRLVYHDGYNRYVLDEKAYTLNVKDNSDENVWNETDTDYSVIKWIGNDSGNYHFVITELGDKVFSSNGTFDQFVAFYLDGKKLERDVDYTAESGSTVITIFDETINGTNDGQSHTIAAEFRTDGTTGDEAPKSEIKRAAQNYTVNLSSSGGSGGGYNPLPTVPDDGGYTQPSQPTDPDDGGSKQFPFTDVKESDWEYEEVKWVYEKDWMVGVSDTLFDPESPVSQAIIVMVLARMQGVDLSKYDGVTYPGIPEGKWYTNAAIWAKQAGLLPDVEFTETAPTGRDQMAIMLVKYLQSMGIDVSGPEVPYEFKDASEMTEAANAAFQALYKLGIFKGVGDMRMAPASNTKRCEFATLVHRISNVIEKSK